MKNFVNTIQRPSSLPAVCAPLATAVSAAWRPADVFLAPVAGRVIAERAIAEQAQVSQAHQVRVAAELALTLATAAGGYASPMFRSTNGVDSVKPRLTVGANGVPPRGRPV